jgi:hypothetical protein
MTRVAVPAFIALFTVVAYVAAAGWNRSGEARLVITLTERELQLSSTGAGSDEDPGLRLRVTYDAPHEPLDARNWLPETRLRELGFTMNVPAGAPQAVYTYDRVPPRLAWVAFEYDGPQWHERERRRQLREPERFPRPGVWSRLVPVDAALDFDMLKRRYPERHLIMRGILGLSYLAASDGGPLLYGRLIEVVPQHVAVPLPFRSLLDGLTFQPEGGAAEPRYDVEVALGGLGVPYVRAVRLTGALGQ